MIDTECSRDGPDAGDFRRLEKKIDALTEEVRGLARSHHELAIWRATIEARLSAGVEHMARLEAGIAACVEKRVVLAYMAGAGLAGAGLLRLLGGG